MFRQIGSIWRSSTPCFLQLKQRQKIHLWIVIHCVLGIKQGEQLAGGVDNQVAPYLSPPTPDKVLFKLVWNLGSSCLSFLRVPGCGYMPPCLAKEYVFNIECLNYNRTNSRLIILLLLYISKLKTVSGKICPHLIYQLKHNLKFKEGKLSLN